MSESDALVKHLDINFDYLPYIDPSDTEGEDPENLWAAHTSLRTALGSVWDEAGESHVMLCTNDRAKDYWAAGVCSVRVARTKCTKLAIGAVDLLINRRVQGMLKEPSDQLSSLVASCCGPKPGCVKPRH